MKININSINSLNSLIIGVNMKVSIMHYDLPKDNWYADILKNFTYGNLSKFNIDYDIIFNGDKFPEKEDNIDLIDFSEWCNPWHRYIVNNYSKPFICTTAEVLISSLNEYLNRNNIDTKFMLSKIDHFIARSSWTKDMLIQFGISGNKFDIIHYGADLNLFKPINKEPEEPSFLYVGSINRRKGIHHLLDSYLKIMDKTDWKLKLCIGEWNNDENLLGEIKSLLNNNKNIRDRIRLIPFPPIDKLPDIYHRATCFCHIQDYDCPAQCSNPSIWALASGLPLVSLDIGVFRDYIKNGKNGFLCNNTQELQEKMLEITRSDWKKMSKESRKIAEKDHSSEKIAAKYKKVYEKVLDNS